MTGPHQYPRAATTRAVFGRLVAIRRKEAGLIGLQLAEAARMSPSALRHIETGVSSPSLEQLQRLAAPLGTTPKALMADLERVGRYLDSERQTWLYEVRPESAKKLGRLKARPEDYEVFLQEPLLLEGKTLTNEVRLALQEAPPLDTRAPRLLPGDWLEAQEARPPTDEDALDNIDAHDALDALFTAFGGSPDADEPDIDAPPVKDAETRVWHFQPGDGTAVGNGLEVFNALAATRVEGQRQANILVWFTDVDDVAAHIERRGADGQLLPSGPDPVAISGAPAGLPDTMIESLARLLEGSDR